MHVALMLNARALPHAVHFACQGIDLRENGLHSSPKLEQARVVLRAAVPFYQEDRFFAPDIETAATLLAERCLSGLLPSGILPSVD